jgi:transcription elongation GreA/GreB family factor
MAAGAVGRRYALAPWSASEKCVADSWTMTAPPLDKRALLDAALRCLAGDAAGMKAAADTAREGAVHEESRPENDKDTRGLETSYLARGQAERAVAIAATLARLKLMPLMDFDDDDAIALSALVEVLVDGEPRTLFVVSEGGGLRVACGEREVLLITPASPAGQALVGRAVGDEFSVVVAGRPRLYEVTSVR